MTRAAILACWPWFATLIVLVVCLRLTVRLNQARPQWRRVVRLHADEGGGAQTLSFVLTLPIFIMVMMLIVQVSQLMIGTIVVHYAAFAAARAAVVWIPANLGYTPSWTTGVATTAENYIGEISDSDDYSEPRDGHKTYYFTPPDDLRWKKIKLAAVLACMPICPSRDNAATSGGGDQISSALQAVYAAMAPDTTSNDRIPRRLINKYAYSLEHTKIGDPDNGDKIRFDHSYREPPLVRHIPADAPWTNPSQPVFDFQENNEIGWQDQLTITVTHDLALLPGPGRLLAKIATNSTVTEDKVAETINAQKTTTYTYPLTAQATLGNLGEKSVVYYVYQDND
jgi:hypothetical protein